MAGHKSIVAVLVSVLLVTGSLRAVADQGEVDTLAYDGIERTFYLHLPSAYDEAQLAPLLVALHPRSSTGRTMAILTGLDAAADAAGFIVVYPNTVETAWGEDATQADAPDDVGFIRALIDHLAETYSIDQERVYLTGYGNGGLMAYRLACELPERFASIAVVGPLLWDYHRDHCPESPAAPVSLLIIHGTEDTFYTPETHTYVPRFDEGEYVILGEDDTLQFWAARNGCAAEMIGRADDANTRIFGPCDGDVTVALYRVLGGGHNWPRTGPYTLNQFGVDASTIITAFFAGDDDWATPQPEPFTGQARTYVAYVPSTYDPSEPTPLVITLQGRYGSGAGTAAYTGMNRVAEDNGFIALFPDALPNLGVNDNTDTGWNYYYGLPYFGEQGPDDTAFLAALIDDLAVDLNIDRGRVYVDGFSNGGFMVHHLACLDAERYAAFATVAGSGYLAMDSNCQQDIPVPMLIIHGTADDNVLWNGLTETIGGRQVYSILPVADVVGFWAEHNGCDPEAIERTDIPPGGLSPQTQVRVVHIGGCQGGAEVVLYGIIGGGHNWPGAGTPGEVEANVNLDIDAGEVIWEFFAAHERNAGG